MELFDKEYCKTYCKEEFTHKGVVIHKIEYLDQKNEADPAIVIGYLPNNGFTSQDEVCQRVAVNISDKAKEQIYAELKAEVLQRVDARIDNEAIRRIEQ